MHRFTLLVFVLIVIVSTVYAASDAVRVNGDLKVDGIHFSDSSTMYSSKDLLKNKGAWESGKLYSAGDVVQTQSGSYVCTTANTNNTPPNVSYWSILSGLTSLIKLTQEASGANCVAGGVGISSGIDSNRNAVLDEAEIATTMYACNGVAGNSPPVANAGINQNVATGSLVTLDGSASSDSNGDPLTYSWSFTSKPGGSSASLSSATAVMPTFTADVAGDYLFNLLVNDGKANSSIATVTVTVSGQGTLSLSAAAPVGAGGVVNLTATAVLTPVLAGLNVDFTVVQYGFNSGSGTVEITFTYNESQYTDSTGTAVLFHNINQQSFATTLEVTATSGGLQKTVRIPVAAALP